MPQLAQFVIIEGSIKMPDGFKGPGSVISIDEADAKKMDPTGTCLMPKDKYDAQHKAAPKAETEKPSHPTKTETAKAEKGGK